MSQPFYKTKATQMRLIFFAFIWLYTSCGITTSDVVVKNADEFKEAVKHIEKGDEYLDFTPLRLIGVLSPPLILATPVLGVDFVYTSTMLAIFICVYLV